MFKPKPCIHVPVLKTKFILNVDGAIIILIHLNRQDMLHVGNMCFKGVKFQVYLIHSGYT